MGLIYFGFGENVLFSMSKVIVINQKYCLRSIQVL
jgi:hypothetical protein